MFLVLVASSLLCACTGVPFGTAPVTELCAVQFLEPLPARAAESRRSVLPWGDARMDRIPASTVPRQAKTIAMAPRRAEGLSGDWLGVLSQESTRSDGIPVSLDQFFRVSLEQVGTTITGSGEIGTGERLTISGTVEKGHSQGIIENVTYGVASPFVGTVSDEEIVVQFTRGGRAEGVQGVATLYRQAK